MRAPSGSNIFLRVRGEPLLQIHAAKASFERLNPESKVWVIFDRASRKDVIESVARENQLPTFPCGKYGTLRWLYDACRHATATNESAFFIHLDARCLEQLELKLSGTDVFLSARHELLVLSKRTVTEFLRYCEGGGLKRLQFPNGFDEVRSDFQRAFEVMQNLPVAVSVAESGEETAHLIEYPVYPAHPLHTEKQWRPIDLIVPEDNGPLAGSTEGGRLGRWGIHTVAIVREHLPFLKDWISHHFSVGADFISIYDNTGSEGSASAALHWGLETGEIQQRQISKRGERYGVFTEQVSDAEIQFHLKELREGFGEHRLEIVRWQPRSRTDLRVVYGQAEAIQHFIGRFHGRLDFASFIDCDEFIRCDDIGKVLDSIGPEPGGVVMAQVPRPTRWGKDGPRPVAELEWKGRLTYKNPKVVIRLRGILEVAVHERWALEGGRELVEVPPENIYFDHYNRADTQMLTGEVMALAIHPKWNDVILFRPDGVFVRMTTGCTGTFVKLPNGDTFLLWERWATEVLCKNGIVMKLPRWRTTQSEEFLSQITTIDP